MRGRWWATIVLGAILLAEGVGKLADPRGYFAALAAFRTFDPEILVAVGSAWTALELASGLALLIAGSTPLGARPLGRLGAAGALADAIAYALLLGSAFARGLSIDNCTCFGVFLPQRLSVWTLAQDASMLLFAALQLRRFAALPHGARRLWV